MKWTVSTVIVFSGVLLLSSCWDLTYRDRPRDTEDTSTTSSDSEPVFSDSETGTGDIEDVLKSPCASVRCKTPPGDTCGSDPAKVVRYSMGGYCTADSGEARCVYSTFEESCLAGNCLDGWCPEAVGQSHYCLSPPPPRCEGDELIAYYPHGAAIAEGNVASCVYSQERIACASRCENDACVGDPCSGRICTDPPPRYCHNDILVTWEPNGRCDGRGTCQYNRQETVCQTGCTDGTCNEDAACKHVSCATPPANFCLNDSTLFAYTRRGQCEDGACIYAGDKISCPCINGKCSDDPCLGVKCIFPPPTSCTADGKLKFWDASWVANTLDELCVNGECLYEFSEEPCDQGECVNGRCPEDYCEYRNFYCDLLPPTPDFCDGDIAVSYIEGGVCAGTGYCVWDEVTEECEAGCEAGNCL